MVACEIFSLLELQLKLSSQFYFMMTKDLESQEHNLKTAKIHLPFKEETKYVKYIYIYILFQHYVKRWTQHKRINKVLRARSNLDNSKRKIFLEINLYKSYLVAFNFIFNCFYSTLLLDNHQHFLWYWFNGFISIFVKSVFKRHIFPNSSANSQWFN